MKRFLIGCVVALAGLTTSQGFADCCYPQQYDSCCCANSFNGFYVGGNVGVISNTTHFTDHNGFLVSSSPLSFSNVETSFTGGLQLGYDWQCGSRVLGLVWDWEWADTDHHNRFLEGTVFDRSNRNRLNWYTTIRARAGVNVCDALVYVTAGAVGARYERSFTNSSVFTGRFHDHHTRWGWVGGVGVEFIAWCKVSWGVEVLALNFSRHDRSFTKPVAGVPTRFRFSNSDTAWIARFLVNYRFGDLCSCWGGW